MNGCIGIFRLNHFSVKFLRFSLQLSFHASNKPSRREWIYEDGYTSITRLITSSNSNSEIKLGSISFAYSEAFGVLTKITTGCESASSERNVIQLFLGIKEGLVVGFVHKTSNGIVVTQAFTQTQATSRMHYSKAKSRKHGGWKKNEPPRFPHPTNVIKDAPSNWKCKAEWSNSSFSASKHACMGCKDERGTSLSVDSGSIYRLAFTDWTNDYWRVHIRLDVLKLTKSCSVENGHSPCTPCSKFATLQYQVREVEMTLLNLKAAQQSLISDINFRHSFLHTRYSKRNRSPHLHLLPWPNTKAQQEIPIARILHVKVGGRLPEMARNCVGDPRILDYAADARYSQGLVSFVQPTSGTCARVALSHRKPSFKHFTRNPGVLRI